MTLEKTLQKKFDDLLKHKLYISWLSFLRLQYDMACEKRQYEKAHLINELK